MVILPRKYALRQAVTTDSLHSLHWHADRRSRFPIFTIVIAGVALSVMAVALLISASAILDSTNAFALLAPFLSHLHQHASSVGQVACSGTLWPC